MGKKILGSNVSTHKSIKSLLVFYWILFLLLTIALVLVFHSHERLITLAGHKWYKYTEIFIRTWFFTHEWRINSNSFKWCMIILTDLEFVEPKYVNTDAQIENCLSNSIAVTCIIWRNKVLVSNTVYPYFDTNIGLER